MIEVLSLCLVLFWLNIGVTALPREISLNGPNLTAWPKNIAEQLDNLTRSNAFSGSYACFDADQTSYQWDVEEATIAYLEMKNILTRERLDPALKLIPFLDTNEHKETFFSYYNRLCSVLDDNICYTWAAAVFSGLTLTELKTNVDEMLQSNTGNTTINTVLSESNNGVIVQTNYNVPIPNFYRAQRELYNRLMANGIEVYVLTASHEELVRMVLADPKYGYNVKPQNVIGVSTLLKNNTQFTTARKQIKDNTYDPKQNLNLVFTSYLWAPQTMFVGKYGSLLTYISRWKMPILIAGDTPTSDGYMLLHAYNEARGTTRIWVNRKNSYLTLIQKMQDENAKQQEENQLKVTANKNWIYVIPSDLGPITGLSSDAPGRMKRQKNFDFAVLFYLCIKFCPKGY